jgi:eukaryotic-like serine/threonine-protein kinase
LTDFGLAKRIDGSGAGPTATGAILGTPAYMPPEQAGRTTGDGRPRSTGPAIDVYALGAILYELLTGRTPFLAASPLDTLLQVTRDDPVPPARLNPKTPRDIQTICLKCLEKEPGRRHPTAAALADDLHRYLTDEPITARPAARWERAWKWAKRRPAVVNRKVWGGNWTRAGAWAQAVLMSVLETGRRQGRAAVDYVAAVLRAFGNRLMPRPALLSGR